MKNLLLLTLFLFLINGILSSQEIPDNWTPDANLTTYQETSDPHGGLYSCKVDVGGTTGSTYWMTNTVSITGLTGGDSYSAKAFAKSSTNVKVSYRLAFDDGTNQFSGGSQGEPTWSAINKNNTVPAGATSVVIEFRFQPQTGFVASEENWIDDFTFESPTGTPLTVANGDFESWPVVGIDPMAGDLVISEINSKGSPSWKARYTEIYNTTENTLDLSKVTVNYFDDGAANATHTLNLLGTLEPHAYMVLARNADFNIYYAPLTYDFTFSAPLNGGLDCMQLVHDDNGILDQFNDGPAATISWDVTHQFYRFDFSADGSSIADHWDDAGTNLNGTPKAPNTYTWNPETGNGNWNNNTNWIPEDTPSKGTNVIIAGGTTQPFVGGNDPATPNECLDLTVNSDAIFKIGPGKYLTVHGNITNNGEFRIRSTDAGTGSLLHNDDNAEAIVETYISENQWHSVSAPIDDAFSAVFAGLYLMEFDETNLVLADRWVFISELDHELTEGRSFYAWSESGTTGNTTVHYSGTLNNGDINLSGLSYTSAHPDEGDRGWNLVGNPYPSAINWNSNWSKTNMDATAYIWDGSNYVTWNGTIGTHPNGDISPGQGFLVRANATGATLTIPQDERKHSSQAFYKNDILNQLFLTVEGEGYSDKMIVHFNEESTSGFDSEYDAWKFFGDASAPQLYSVSNEKNLTVNVQPFDGDNTLIPVNFKAGIEGIYTISASEVETFEIAEEIWLEDLQENMVTNMKENQIYTFGAGPNDDVERFVLHFYNSVTDIEESTIEEINIYSYGSKVFIVNPENITGEVRVMDMLGKTVFQSMVSNTNVFEFNLKSDAGYYIVQFSNESKFITEKILVN